MKETINKMIGWTLEGTRDTMTRKVNREANKKAKREAEKKAKREAKRKAKKEASKEANKEEVAAVGAEAGVVVEVERKELVRYLFLTYTITNEDK